MGIGDRAAVNAFLAQLMSGRGERSTAEQRIVMDGLTAVFPLADSVTVEAAHLGGVAGEWVRAPRTRRDAAVLYLHGGAYVVGSPRSHRHLAGALSELCGLAVFSADYRLAPEHPYPAAVDDAVAAYKALLAEGLAPSRLAIAGDSAGGGLTLAALLALRDGGIALPACGVCFSAWADLTNSSVSWRERARREKIVEKARLDAMAASYAGEHDLKTPGVSPLFADLKGLPPLLLQVGSEEALHDDTMALAARAEAAGVEVSLESWAGMVHVWQLFHPMLSEGRDALQRTAAYMKAHMA